MQVFLQNQSYISAEAPVGMAFICLSNKTPSFRDQPKNVTPDLLTAQNNLCLDKERQPCRAFHWGCSVQVHWSIGWSICSRPTKFSLAGQVLNREPSRINPLFTIIYRPPLKMGVFLKTGIFTIVKLSNLMEMARSNLFTIYWMFIQSQLQTNQHPIKEVNSVATLWYNRWPKSGIKLANSNLNITAQQPKWHFI